jgi:rubredoxin
MKCSLCGFVFDEKKGTSACARCPLVTACRLIRCPNCGFETPAEPEWLRRLFGKSTRIFHVGRKISALWASTRPGKWGLLRVKKEKEP